MSVAVVVTFEDRSVGSRMILQMVREVNPLAEASMAAIVLLMMVMVIVAMA